MGAIPDIPEIPLTSAADVQNLDHIDDADLLLFMAGNQFMVMGELLEAFKSRNPHIRQIFYETLPPGLELRQILAGGARFGDKMLTCRPDVYTSVSEEAMLKLKEHGMVDEYSIYLHNRLVLMVQKGNPKDIGGVDDLARDDVRISQPGEMEDITKYISAMYLKAGGEELLNRIMEKKRAKGTTMLTIVHHRETPLRLKTGDADVGPVWATEVVSAQARGESVEAVDVGPELDQHDTVNYYTARLTGAPNPEHGDLFKNFLRYAVAQEIYRSYGFTPHIPD